MPHARFGNGVVHGFWRKRVGAGALLSLGRRDCGRGGKAKGKDGVESCGEAEPVFVHIQILKNISEDIPSKHSSEGIR
jgi:hypothetical protein